MSKTNNGYSKESIHHHHLLEVIEVQSDLVRVQYRMLYRLVMTEILYSSKNHYESDSKELHEIVEKRVQALISNLK